MAFIRGRTFFAILGLLGVFTMHGCYLLQMPFLHQLCDSDYLNGMINYLH